MTHKTSTWFPIALMLLLAALTYWLDLTVSEAGAPRDHGAASDPDFIIDNFRISRMNAGGVTDYVLSATRMEHFREDDVTRISAPSLTHYVPGAPSVQLDARRGVITGSGEVTEFYDEVVLKRQAGAKDAAMVMRTEYLKAFPDSAFASTDRVVTITQGDSVLTGTGLEIDNNARAIRLLSDVRGTFHRVAR